MSTFKRIDVSKKIQANRSKDRVATEKRLLKAAELVFSKTGYDGATTRAIAQAADINLSLINRYFEGKYGLFIALIKNKSKEFKSRELTYSAQESVEEELIFYGDTLLSHYIDSINFIKVSLGKFLSDPKFLKSYRDTIIDTTSAHPEITERLEKLVSKKSRKFSAEKILRDIETYLFGLLIGKFLISGEDEKQIRSELKEFISNYSKHVV